jgi:hypothetical protein
MEMSDALEARQVKAAQNESLFRGVNEQIERLTAEFQVVAPMVEFVCECSDASCVERISLTHDEYEKLRGVPTHFAIRRGHELSEVERIVEEHPLHVVVEKLGAAAAEAIRSDPRD